ncbi:MAG: RluA family pseudouridine synthase [Patescibacteria group bacterium]
MEIERLYEDENVVVINKPAGLVVHFDGRTPELNLCDWILANYPQTEKVGESLVVDPTPHTGILINKFVGEIKRPGIVHRLDRETSGVLIVAKNQKAFLNLKKQFQNREIKKTYNAFVWGRVKNDEGIIDRPIGKSKKDFRLWSAQRGAKGKMREAVTNYKVLQRSADFSFLEIQPQTGRTHQIRVHLKAINHPVVGDKLYASKKGNALGFERLALHSKIIEFALLNGKEIKIEAPLPKDFKNALKLFQ